MTRSDLLRDYLASSTQPVQWGVDDCTMWAARWVRIVSGRDVATHSYGSEAEARSLIVRLGGLPSIWSDALEGFAECFHPQLGDVGLVDTRLAGPVGVIFAAGGLALRRRIDGGVWAFSTAHRALIKAWTI